MVFASSLKVYGDCLPVETSEAAPYGRFSDLSHLSKCYTEKLMEMYAAQYGLRCLAVRLGIAYGVSPVMKRDYRFMTVVNKFCWQAVRGEALVVHSSGFRPKGFLHVADAAAALVAAAGATHLDGFVALNAAGEIKSVWEAAQMVAAAASRRGLQVNILSEEASESAPAIRFSSRLDFHPRHNLQEGVEEVLDYWQKVAG